MVVGLVTDALSMNGDHALESMYQEIILDAAKHPHGKTTLVSSDVLTVAERADDDAAVLLNQSSVHAVQAHEGCLLGRSHQFNPTCGDEVTLQVTLRVDGQHIERVAWDGHGCSISQASLSMMVDLVEGRSVEHALACAQAFRELMNSRGEGLHDEQQETLLDDAVCLQGVSRYPMRIKCALLAWEALKDGVAQALADK